MTLTTSLRRGQVMLFILPANHPNSMLYYKLQELLQWEYKLETVNKMDVFVYLKGYKLTQIDFIISVRHTPEKSDIL